MGLINFPMFTRVYVIEHRANAHIYRFDPGGLIHPGTKKTVNLTAITRHYTHFCLF